MPAATPIDFDGQRQTVQRQRKLADALRGRNQQPSGQMVGGFYVAPNVLEHLVPVANQGMAAWSDYETDKQENALGQQETKAFQEWTSAIPRARQVTRQESVTPSTAVDELGIPNPMIQQQVTETVKPTRADRIDWLAKGMALPMARGAASKGLVDQLDMQPKALGESAYVDAEGEVRPNEGWLANKRDALAQRASELEQRMEDRRLDRESRAALERASYETRVELARVNAQARVEAAQIGANARRDVAGLAADGRNNKPPSDKIVGELATMDADEEALATGIAMLEKASGNNTGWVAGAVQNYVPGGQSLVSKVRDPETNKAVQFITFLTDGIRHGRFGSALTATEKASAMQYLPGEYDDKSQILQKANGLQELLTKRHAIVRRARLGEATGGTGGRPATPFPASPAPGRPTVAPPSGGAAPPPLDPGMGTGSYENPVLFGADPEADYDSLPSGMHYFHPTTGEKRIKR